MPAPFDDRRERLKRTLREAGADAAALYPGPNMYYVSGFWGEPADRYVLLLVPADGAATFVVPEHYAGQIRDDTPVGDLHTVGANDPAEVAAGLIDVLPADPASVLLDGETRQLVARHLHDALPADAIGAADPLLRELRIRKDEEEVAAMRRAGAVADAVSEEVRAFGDDAVGMTEEELAVEIRGRLFAKGGRRLSFDVSVGSGPNSARPFARAGDREIRAGEPVVLDFGAFVDRYASDQTRAVVFAGDPPDGFEEAHATVKAALDTGVEHAEPGIEAEELDRIVSGVIEDRGLGDAMRHRTGHGVGLEAHEELAIAEGNDTVLEPGMVFSIEPGVYFEGEWGVRVEDLVAITDDGAERLNGSAYGWRPP